jgi:hypothetical protein
MKIGHKLERCNTIDQLSQLYDNLAWQHDFGRKATLEGHSGFLIQEDCIERARIIFEKKPEPAKTLKFIKAVRFVNHFTDRPVFTLASPIQSFFTSIVKFFEDLFSNWKLSSLEKRVTQAIEKENRSKKIKAETQKILKNRTAPYRRPPQPLIPECYLKKPPSPPKPNATHWALE